ncbi:MAG: carbohydrate kinase [Desulfobacteraceae bacterium]|jgi:fructokinase
MIVVIGEILIDRFPNYERIGGAPFNFAFHIRQMGWPVRFLTRIGDDAAGRQVLQALQECGLYTADVQVDAHHPTGLVEVSLDGRGVPQFDICADAAYDYLDLSLVPAVQVSSAKMVYYGTLIQRTGQGYRQTQAFLEQMRPATCGFCDINLRPPHIRREAIQSSLRHSDILKLNTQELMQISAMLGGPQEQTRAAEWLLQTHALSQIVLTMGADGSKVITAGQTITSPPAKIDTIVDTVGAGDAYAAVFAAGCLKALPLERTLALATGFAADICGLPGAVPTDLGLYKHLRREMSP